MVFWEAVVDCWFAFGEVVCSKACRRHFALRDHFFGVAESVVGPSGVGASLSECDSPDVIVYAFGGCVDPAETNCFVYCINV